MARDTHRTVMALGVSAFVAVACGSSADPTYEQKSPLFDGCVADCSAIAAPACSKAQCNRSTGQCETVPTDGDACDDGLFCTVHDRCQGGRCQGDPSDCGLAPQTCKATACDETSRTCHYVDQPDGTKCSSTNACAVGATCQSGQCVTELKTCYFTAGPDACHAVACNPTTGACDQPVPASDFTDCTIDMCTVGATCSAGTCANGQPRQCSAWTNECNTAACDKTKGCYGVPANSGKPCSIHDPCNTGTCSATGGCVMTPSGDGSACSDGIVCTTNDQCSAGKCVGVAGAGGPTVYFRDTFASNAAAGWTTEGTWMIGPTRRITSQPYSPCKPFRDHTQSPSGDNGVATTELGGHDGEYTHDFTYLTSPPIDTSSASSLVLVFSYILEWALPPYDEAVVDVFDGSSWSRVWESQDNPLYCADPNTRQYIWRSGQIDIASHKGPAMRVRFGVAAHVVRPFAGWTLDDVAVMSAPCP